MWCDWNYENYSQYCRTKASDGEHDRKKRELGYLGLFIFFGAKLGLFFSPLVPSIKRCKNGTISMFKHFLSEASLCAQKKNKCLEENKNASHIFFDMNTYYIKWMNENDG